MLKLLLHVPDSSRFEAALKQARNFAIAMGDKPYQVRILVNFEGVTVLNDLSPYAPLLQENFSLGIEVYFCENAMKTFNVSMDKVPQQAKTVPAGIVALVTWQDEGFRYVRA
ncbi:MAG: DsrE family protein [Thermodesulfobacteriaceae bacterium]|jgi:intracellular sulfur oxidation DsrE/DsrF family protein